MRVAYHPLSEREFVERLKHDVGDVLTMGDGLGDINIFRKHRLTKGSGAFSNLILKYGKRLLPYLKKFLWPAAKEFGRDVMGDVASGDATLKSALKKRGKQSLAKVGRRIISGEGRKRRSLKRKCKKGRGMKRSVRWKKGVKRRRRKRRTTLGKGKAKKRHGGGTRKKMTNSGGRARRTRKKRLVKKKTIIRKRRKVTGKLDCSRPSSRKMCHKDIFSM